MTDARRYRVIKLGGSLLDLDGLVPRLRHWLAAQPAATDVTVVGGGRLADTVREAFVRHQLGEEAAHWLCVRLLGVTAELVHRLFPESRLVERFAELSSDARADQLVFFQAERFLRIEEPCLFPAPLPHTWDVTSDSIAARLATLLRAGELVLLKSGLPADGATASDAARDGYVDGHFPVAAAGLPIIRCVNLRSEKCPEVTLRLGPACVNLET
jgi:aspartokinase-like uncharacterized kinase